MLEWLIPGLDWYIVLSHLRDLVLACLLAIPIAWEREVDIAPSDFGRSR